jgi:hypothetical protein
VCTIEIPAEQKEQLRIALLAYCEMETMGMVEVYGRLREVGGS